MPSQQISDLNDIYYFAKIVEHGSFSAAAEALGIAKSVLSHHLARLEADLGVRLIQRTTRRLQITDVGARYYKRCVAVLSEVELAGSMIDSERDTARGSVRVVCPINFAQVFLAPVLANFMAEHEHVEVLVDVANREVDLIAENYDLALRIVPDIKSSTLIVRSFTLARHRLVASPALVQRHGLPRTPEDLRSMPSLGGVVPNLRGGRFTWNLRGPDGQERMIAHQPRLISEDLFILKDAVLAGCGVVDLPMGIVGEALRHGELLHLLPQWQLPELNLYAVYPSRKGLTLATRTFIDYLTEHLEPMLASVTNNTLSIGLTSNALSRFDA